jgi:signal transduction histidine kinase
MDHLKRGKLAPIFRPKRFTTIVALLIIGAGIASGVFAALTNQTNKSQYLVGRAQTIADSLSADDLESLKGSDDDLATLAYSRAKQQLDQVRNSNLDIAYIRAFKIANQRVSINIDAQPEGSIFYGPPGLAVPEPSHQLRSALLDGTPSFDPIVSDYSEHWVAGYAPVRNADGEIVAAVGVFASANTYYLEIALYALVPLLLAVIPFAGIMRDIKIQAKEHEILQLKNQFISIASHELRSPLTGMLWGIQSLQRSNKKLSNTENDLLNDMYRSTEASLATVNEILDSSIFERGQANKLHREYVDIVTVLDQVTSTLMLGAKERDISIEKVGKWPDTAHTVGDVEALKRAFMNVFANAIKYSNVQSSIKISYRLDDKREHVITVQDHGIGIPHDEQEKVLEGYYRATNASAVHANGTGLGLWTTRMTIEAHGGRVWLNSLQDKGTAVYLALPAKVPTGVSAQESAAQA